MGSKNKSINTKLVIIAILSIVLSVALLIVGIVNLIDAISADFPKTAKMVLSIFLLVDFLLSFGFGVYGVIVGISEKEEV